MERCIRCNRSVRGGSHVFADSTGMEGPYCGGCADGVRARRELRALSLEAARRKEEYRDDETADAA